MKKLVILSFMLLGTASLLSGCAGAYEGYEGRNPSGGYYN